ncbi:parallel beta-helix repeat protein [Methanococcus maripaludis]|uniref:Parallel beta-helix repeat protein n=1 Tax=Methanococcus maripaludis TaxID=39152 RepID=A0A7J9P0H0_METMI|nr:NosD domain-containing protein [Methanococcus maripaludis]MBA2853037.1 parallel beta-helix repeat protein [Methanococcus maripaludis]
MIKKCLLFLLLLFAVGSVNAVDITGYSSQTDVDIDSYTYHAFVVIDEPGEYVVKADFTNNSLGNDNIVFLIKDTQDVTLDCNNMSFTTNTTNWPNYLVYAYNSTNIVVKNMNANWSTDTIIFENVNDSTIENSEIISEGYPIDLYDSYGLTISGNTITNTDEGYGIYFEDNLENSTISGNTINITNEDSAYGIYVVDYTINSVISGNTITAHVNSTAYGMYLDEDVIDSTIENNVIDIYSEWSDAYGIDAYYDLTNSLISGNTITVNSTNDYAYGIYTDDYVENSTISGNTITANAYSNAYGIRDDEDTINSTIENNVIDVYAYDDYAYGMYLYGEITDSTILGNTITAKSNSSEAYGIFTDYDMVDSTISGNTITANAYYYAYGIYDDDDDIINSTIENNIIDIYSEDEDAYGINVYYNLENSLISGNTITANAYYYAYGIYIDEYTINSTISGNDITVDSYEDYAYGIDLDYDVMNSTVENNVVDVYSELDEAYGILAYYDLENSTISGNTVTVESYEYYAYGIYVDDYTINSIISGNIVTVDSYYEADGICCDEDVLNSTIFDNKVAVTSEDDDTYGIYSYYTINSTISGNTIKAESPSDYAYGIYIDDYTINSTISENTVTATAGEYGAYAYGAYIYQIEYCLLSGNAFTVISENEESYGIYIDDYTINSTISENTVTATSKYDVFGIYCEEDAINSTIENTVITVTSEQDNAFGIYSCNGEYSTYSENTITADAYYEAYGLCIEYIDNMTISGNTVDVTSETDWAYDIYLYDISNSTIFENTFTSNMYALYIDSTCEENRFYLNNIDGLLNNGTDNYFVSSETITYSYNGKSYTSILGNYWVGYDESDTNGDGIIDTPYTLNGTNDTKPLTDVWNDGEIGNYVAPSRSSGGGRSYDSDISDEIESKVIKNFVSSATVLFGNGIDEQYAVQLRERVTDANGFIISGNAVIVGGPLANPFAREYNEQFEMPISNDNPGENRGIIQFMTIQDNSGTIIRSYTIVYIAGSDRLGTQAALEYFKTLDELPEGPLMVEWTADGPVVVE